MKYRHLLGLFLITAATLIIEVAQTRVLSVLMHYHLVFIVVSMAMFGLAAGAILVHLRKLGQNVAELSSTLSNWSLAFALATVIAMVLERQIFIPIEIWPSAVIPLFLMVLCITVPFVLSGVVVCLVLTKCNLAPGRAYCADLFGAASGCLGALVIMRLTTGPSAVLWGATLAALAALIFNDKREKKTLICVAFVLFCAIGATANFLPFQLVRVKGRLHLHRTVEYEEWNSFSRITVHVHPGKKPLMWGASPKFKNKKWEIGQKELLIDGDATTHLYNHQGDLNKLAFLKEDVTSLAYWLPQRKSVAIIGSGGGRDLLTAKVFGSQSVLGVELNPIFRKLLYEHPTYSPYAGIKELPGVDVVVDEARSWFSRANQQFDLIQMSLIDTWAATQAGAFTLSENGLYTVEGWQLFLSRLSKRGALTVSRWFTPGAVDETGRMVSLAVATLLRQGHKNPQDHIFLATSDRIATLVLRKNPFTKEEVQSLLRACKKLDYTVHLAPGKPVSNETFKTICSAKGEADLFNATSPLALDLSPATDDKPFFFVLVPFHRLHKALAQLKKTGMMKNGKPTLIWGNVKAALLLVILLVITMVIVVAIVILPYMQVRQLVDSAYLRDATAYFFLIGFGFMVVEIGLLQRVSVFLGHPVYALGIVLFTIISAAGLGSYISEDFSLLQGKRLSYWAFITFLFVLVFALCGQLVLAKFVSSDLLVRTAISGLILVPAGILLGFAFPTGLKLVQKIDGRPAPWLWGVNGGAGVLGSVIATTLSISCGITTTLIVGGFCYLLTLIVSRRLYGRYCA